MSDLKSIKLSRPTVPDIIPSTKEKIKVTPFTVGDEKLLLIASESKDGVAMANTLMQIVENCIEGEGKDKLKPYDYEYLFLKIRAISVGETSEIGIKCKSCDAANRLAVNVTDITVNNVEKNIETIKIDDNLGFKMKIPSLSKTAELDVSSVDSIFNLIISCIDAVYYGEDVIEIDDSNLNDLNSIIEQLSSEQFMKLRDFYENIPKVTKNIEFTCGSCNHDNKLRLEGLASFF